MSGHEPVAVVDSTDSGPAHLIAKSLGRPVVAPSDEEALRSLSVAIVTDGHALTASRDADVPTRVAVLPALSARWRSGDLTDAHVICVPLDGFEKALPSDLRARAVVTGPLAPDGFMPGDREALKAAHGIEGAVVLITHELLDEHGPNAVLVQLGLTNSVTVVFDVGVDVESADALRRLAPIHDVPGYIFADGPDAFAHWQLADVVVTAPNDPAVMSALSVGAPLVVMEDPRHAIASSVLRDAGVASEASLSTLAVELEVALVPATLAARRDKIAALDGASSIDRIVARSKEAYVAGRGRRRALPKGLPIGLEPLPTEPVAEATRHAKGDGSAERARSEADLESKIDAELEALKKRLK